MAKSRRKLLILGDTGKMGTAVRWAFGRDFETVGLCRPQIDAENLGLLTSVVAHERPDILVNAIAFLGIDACEEDPERALRINTLFPKRLAELSRERDFTLVHISTDAVFGDVFDRFCVESDPVNPFNTYALTKYGGDCFVRSISPEAYVFRLPLLFGDSRSQGQFVEKMLARARSGARRLRISSDVVSTPSYSRDVALEIRRVIESSLAPGLYHVANEGRGSLFELIEMLVRELGLPVDVEPVCHERFPSTGRKNLYTTMKSEKIPALRPWREAFHEYCKNLKDSSEAVAFPPSRSELGRVRAGVSANPSDPN